MRERTSLVQVQLFLRPHSKSLKRFKLKAKIEKKLAYVIVSRVLLYASKNTMSDETENGTDPQKQ